MKSRSMRPALALAFACICSSVAAEEIHVVTTPAAGATDTGVEVGVLSDLEEKFTSGDFAAARLEAAKAVDGAAKRSGSKAFDYNANTLAVLWVGSDAAGESVVRRLMLPAPSSHAASLDLPGLHASASGPQLYEVLLSLDKRSTLVSEYTFKRESNPLEAELPAVIETIAGPVFSFLGSVASGVRERNARQSLAPGAPPASIWALANHVRVPFHRAAVSVRTFVKVPVDPKQEWPEAVGVLAQSLRFQQVPRSAAARSCADKYEAAACSTALASDCFGSRSTPAKCLLAFDAAFQKEYADCTAAVPLTAEADLKAIAVVDDKFREFVTTGRAARTTGESEFRNAPRTHFAFGLGTGFILHARLDKQRVKLDDAGLLVGDPLPRPMTMAMLHWSPSGYDRDSPKLQAAERLRPFAAAILTPDVGIAVGGSVLLVRGVGLNIGAGRLFAKAANANDQLGAAPTKASDSFSVAQGWVYFGGINVGFK